MTAESMATARGGHLLRPYQQTVVEQVAAAVVRGIRSLCVVMPTGAGKTHVAIDLIHRAIAKGQRCLFFAHTRELVFQPRDRLSDAGIDAGVILAGQEPDLEQLVQVASVQTLTARAIRTRRAVRLRCFPGSTRWTAWSSHAG